MRVKRLLHLALVLLSASCCLAARPVQPVARIASSSKASGTQRSASSRAAEVEVVPGLSLHHNQTQLDHAGLNAQQLEASGLDVDSTVFGAQASKVLPHLLDHSLSDTEPRTPLDLEWAQRMGRLTSVAYCSDPNVIKQWKGVRAEKIPQFKPYEVVFDEQWDLMAYIGYDEARDAITLAFRGTDSRSWGNWINNLKAWRANHMYPIPQAPRAMVHAGFFDLWTKSSLQSNFTTLVGQLLKEHPTPRLFITGHSMGAALGSLAALDLKFKYGFTEVRSWTFGSPRVGNAVWAQLFAEHVVESWRFTHNRDVVPSLPPQIIGFHHTAREAWTVDFSGASGLIEQKVLICDDSGEDPSCHNSACMLGLCTSVADHLMYLGVEMYRDEMEC